MSAAVDTAAIRWVRFEQAWEAVKWTIAHDPENGLALTESGTQRVAEFRRLVSIQIPQITVVYEIDQHEITITAVRFEDGSAGNA